jgi:hypothetical protein
MALKHSQSLSQPTKTGRTGHLPEAESGQNTTTEQKRQLWVRKLEHATIDALF